MTPLEAAALLRSRDRVCNEHLDPGGLPLAAPIVADALRQKLTVLSLVIDMFEDVAQGHDAEEMASNARDALDHATHILDALDGGILPGRGAPPVSDPRDVALIAWGRAIADLDATRGMARIERAVALTKARDVVCEMAVAAYTIDIERQNAADRQAAQVGVDHG